MSDNPKGFTRIDAKYVPAFSSVPVAEKICEDLTETVVTAVNHCLIANPLINVESLSKSMETLLIRIDSIHLIFDTVAESLESMCERIYKLLREHKDIPPPVKLDLINKLLTTSNNNLEATESDDMARMSHDEANRAIKQIDVKAYVYDELYPSIMHSAGYRVGLSFAIDLMEYLKERELSEDTHGALPLDYDALLEFWTLFDSSTDFGQFSFSLQSDPEGHTFDIAVKESFLVQKYDERIHRHCAFLEGYIHGTLDGSFAQWVRWINSTHYRPPSRNLEISSVKEHSQTENNCVFRCETSPEKLPGSKDLLIHSIECLWEKDYHECYISLRKSLENAVKELVELQDDDILKFTQLINCFQECGVGISYEKWRRLYGVLSGAAHSRPKGTVFTQYDTLMSLVDTWILLKELPAKLPPQQELELQKMKGQYCAGKGSAGRGK
jgi:hypothetical protein